MAIRPLHRSGAMNHVKTADKKVHPLKTFFVELFSVRAGLYIKQTHSVHKPKG
jgi:hypothetical protein